MENGCNKLPPKMMDRNKKEDKTSRWLTVLSDFCQDTTFHGIKHIAENQRYVTRRLAWLLLFLGGSSIFLLQLSTCITYYLSWPVSVDVKINYNDSIIFPAVTICNKNAFRASEAYKRGYYDYISELFGSKEIQNITGMQETGALDLEYLYRTLGHTQQDLIIGCEWGGGVCSPDDVITVMTDYGMCYTFNSGKNNTPLKLAYQAGSNGGLRLQLNIEQYEYMRGPNTGAGLKILVHNQDEVPLVKDYGIAVPSGSHGYVAVRTLKVNNLEPYHGECNDSVKLAYFEDYAMYNCYTNCKEEFLVDKCGCRDFYMPSVKGFPGVCDMETYKSCMIPALELFSEVKESCYCPVTCQSRLYEQTVSFASASNFDVGSLLDSNTSDKFRNKYVAAREVCQRVHKSTVEKDTEQITVFNQTVQALTTMFVEVQVQFASTLACIERTFASVQQRMNFHMDRGLTAVEYIIDHDFLRGWEVYHERAYHFITLDFMGFSQILNRTIVSAAQRFDLDTNETREWVYFPIRDMFLARLDVLERAEEFLNKTNHAFLTGEPLLTYSLTLDRRYDMTYITLPLLQDFSSDQEQQYNKLLEGLHWMKLGVNVLQNTGEQFVETGFFNSTEFIYGEDRFLTGGKRVNYMLFMYKTRVLDKPVEEIRSRIAELELANRTIIDNYETVERSLKELKELLDEVINTTWAEVVNLSATSSTYLSDATALKTNLSMYTTSFRIHTSVHAVRSFFDDFKIRARTLEVDIMNLKLSFINVWSLMLLENSTTEFYKMLNNDTTHFLESDHNDSFYLPIFAHLLRTDPAALGQWTKEEIVEKINGDFHGLHIEEVMKEVDTAFEGFSEAMHVSKHIGELDEVFLEAFDEYHTEMNAFLEGNEINSEFYRQNVMTLDVFMQELSYHEITQQKAYSISQLVSDIGGSMGLFIGGSVLSIFEFLDIWVHNCCMTYVDGN